MNATNKISTLRSNGFSVVNCNGLVCRIESEVPFTYGDKVVDVKASQGTYRLTIRGHYKTELPKVITL